MPIPLPNLDDRTYAELTAEAQALIPSLHPAWTNHNPSDPGIVLVEMLAWLTEMLLFQVNEIPAASTAKFLKLLNGPQWTRPDDLILDAAIGQTMRDLRERYRAVTPDDYEYLALHAWLQSEAARNMGSAAIVRRVRCVPRRNLEAADPSVRGAPAPAHVSLVVVPEPAPGENYPQPTDALRAGLSSFFAPRRTLTTRHHVVGPTYVEVGIAANLALHADAPPADALDGARRALAAFFDPLAGGPDRRGWPFGRDVYASEVYAVLEQVRLVNYVEDVRLSGPNPVKARDGSVAGVKLDAHELVKLQLPTLVAYDVYGKQYQ
jgi:hypothetical protein